MSHLEELREREPKVAEYIEDNEEAVRACTGECTDCHKVNTCFN